MDFSRFSMSGFSKSFELPISAHVADPQVDTFYHSHDFCEIAIVSAGTGKQRVYGRGAFDAKKGDVFILPPGTAHGYSDVAGMAVINVLFSPSRIPIPELDIARFEAFKFFGTAEKPQSGRGGQFLYLRLNEKEFAEAKRLALQIDSEKKASKDGVNYILYCLLLELLGRLCLCEYLKRRRTERYRYIDKAVEAVKRARGGSLRLEELAKETGMSERNMRRQFKKATGAAPLRYLMEQRVREGAEMLRSTSLPVGEIATACGFCDGSYFSLQFKKLIGVAPTAYRKRTARETTADGRTLE